MRLFGRVTNILQVQYIWIKAKT